MTELPDSFRRVDYQLRSAKQVERRMLIDAFTRLAAAGFQIPDYQYTGMGSIYFVDFCLFHKFLGISQMLSVEASQAAAKRVEFNRPFSEVKIELKFIGDVVPELSRELRHILWLDYDQRLSQSIISDARTSAATLTEGSILLVTVDVEAWDDIQWARGEVKARLESIGRDVSGSIRARDVSKSQFPSTIARILRNAIDAGLEGRTGVTYRPLFSFEYSDGHRMLTVGGMICGRKEVRMLNRSTLPGCIYYRPRSVSEPYAIKIPRVTRKERLVLDANMPRRNGWVPQEFEMSEEEIRCYSEIYRFLPAFAELML